MPRYAVTLNESADYTVIVDADNEEAASEAAEDVFLDAANMMVFHVGNITRETETVALADEGEELTESHKLYHMTAERSPIELAAPNLAAAVNAFVEEFGEVMETDDPIGGADAVDAICRMWPLFKAAKAKMEGR
jgi:hypothetical protein